MLEKAVGVYLWAILVVDVLNRDNQRGLLVLRKRLAEVPSGLSDPFKDLLRRDARNMEELLLCILCILLAKRLEARRVLPCPLVSTSFEGSC